jgi:DNA-3-methyladenine glycosylase
VAPELLNKVLAVYRAGSGWRWVRLVEVEAYASHDAASHSYGGPRGRNTLMYGEAAHLYVYFSYGMHWCANIVTGPVGSGQAVLLRAAEPVGGVEAMVAARSGGKPADELRPSRRPWAVRDLCRGPGRLAQALGVTGSDYGAKLAVGRGTLRGRRDLEADAVVVAVLDDGVAPPAQPGNGPRVGISKAVDVPWRWWVPGSRFVSGRGAPRS